MTYVIAEPCIDVLDLSCVSVCPVDCIHYDEGTDRKLFIDPNECIDCGACEPVCPTKAIFAESDLPEKWNEYKKLNAEFSVKWPNINEKKAGLPEAEEFKDKADKRSLFDPTPAK